jgi:hypothetical protein
MRTLGIIAAAGAVGLSAAAWIADGGSPYRTSVASVNVDVTQVAPVSTHYVAEMIWVYGGLG